MISAVLIALNSGDAAQRAECIDALADLLQQGAATAFYVGDDFRGIVNAYTPAPTLPPLQPALA